MQCTQIVVYRVRPEALEAFRALKEQLITEAHTLEGLLSSVTLASAEDPHLFVDQMQWTSHEAAAASTPAFERLPSTPRFMGLLAGPPVLAGEFLHAAGDGLERPSA
ncbi:MAG: antibiotic biosynthesis monooxygenase [Myxococcota bacterium]